MNDFKSKSGFEAFKPKIKKYVDKNFKDVLPRIKTLMSNHPNHIFKQLQMICAEVGVKVVYTPCLPKAPISGSTRWINDTPLIQLTGRYNRNDSFWFTFFHEAGHIILHGKKDIFIEDFEYSEKDKNKEIEADCFAIKWTLSKEEQQEIIEAVPLNKEDIERFAKKFNTHPAIIIGRLHHDKLVPYSLGRQFITQIDFN